MRDWATAAVSERDGALDGEEEEEEEVEPVSGAAMPVRRKTEKANLSMSLSVTSHRLATRAGLRDGQESVNERLAGGARRRMRERDAPACDHVVVGRADGLKVALILEETGRAAPKHRDGAAREVAYRLRPDVLLGAAVAEEAANAPTTYQSTRRRTQSRESRERRARTGRAPC